MKATLYFRRKGETGWNFLDPFMMAWILERMPDVAELQPDGNGTELSPWRMTTIGQWAKAAKQSILPRQAPRFKNLEEIQLFKTQNPNWQALTSGDLYLVGGHLLERNPSTGGFANYITGVADAGKPGGEWPHGKSSSDRPRSFARHDASQDPRTIYAVKGVRLQEAMTATLASDVTTAKEARALMKGTLSVATNDELPGTLGALFIAEASREKRMIPLGLMLMDLIECGVKYGESSGLKKQYTWASLMSNPSDLTDRDWGGKHPMLHDGTIAQSKVMFSQVNAVTKKSISALTAWLSLRLKTTAPGWDVAVGTRKALEADLSRLKQAYDAHSQKLDGMKKAEQQPSSEDLQLAKALMKAKPAMEKRVGQLSKDSIGASDKKPYDQGAPKARLDSTETDAFTFYLQAIKPALEDRVKNLDCQLSPDSVIPYISHWT